MTKRPHTMLFILAALSAAVGLGTDFFHGSLGTRLGFTGMYSVCLALAGGVLMWTARNEPAQLRLSRIVIVVLGALFSLNFMRLGVKWGNASGDFDPRTICAALLCPAWAFMIGVLIMAHFEPSRKKATAKPPIFLRFGTVLSALVVVVVLIAVKGLHSPTASMARDLFAPGASTPAEPIEVEDLPPSVPRGARDADRNPVKKQSVPKYSIGPIA